MVLLIEVVVDLEGWDRRVPEIGVTGNRVVVDYVIVRGQRNHGLNLQRHRIEQRRRNDVVRERIADSGTVCGESRRSWIVNRISENRTPERIRRRLAREQQLGQQRLAEIALSHPQSRNRCNSRVDELRFTILLEIEKKECLVVAVVELPQLDGTADVEPVVILPLPVPDVLAGSSEVTDGNPVRAWS